jgi:hypothetical protein
MSDESSHITRPELAAELRSVRYEMRLLIVGLVVVLKLNLPDTITVPALSALAIKTLWGMVAAYHG